MRVTPDMCILVSVLQWLAMGACQRTATTVLALQTAGEQHSDNDVEIDTEPEQPGGSSTLPDAGAGCVRFVDGAAAASSPDGMSWSTAFAEVQQGVDAAAEVSPCEVWVALGHYLVFDASPTDTILLRQDVFVLGGFDGTETSRSERDWRRNTTTLDGSDSVYHVVTGAAGAVLDGFVVTGGNASGAGSDGRGGGLVTMGTYEVANCTFRSNAATELGGAIFSELIPTPIVDCLFLENTSQGSGGAISLLRASSWISNSVFVENRSTDSGGALHVQTSSPTIVNCTFTSNHAGSDGEAVFVDFTSAPSLTNCILWDDEPGELNLDRGNGTSITYSNVAAHSGGTGNLNEEPRFVDVTGRDFSLARDSPCIDAGNGAVAPALDAAGNPRVDVGDVPNTGTGSPQFVDMGAFEYQPRP